MPDDSFNSLFTVVADLPDGVFVSQHAGSTPAQALREALRHIESAAPTRFDSVDKDLLLELANSENGDSALTPVENCNNTWVWLAGSGTGEPVVVYVIQTIQTQLQTAHPREEVLT
jgi:hypothetical protein